MKVTWVILALILAIPSAYSDDQPISKERFEKGRDEVAAVLSGFIKEDPLARVKIKSLTASSNDIESKFIPEQWADVIRIVYQNMTVMTLPPTGTSLSCIGLSGVCEDACNAANELKMASDSLSKCSGNLDDDCSRQFRNVKYAHENYEMLMMDAGLSCN